MNRLTRIAFDLLAEHKTALLTTDNTTIDGRGKNKKVLINLTTAKALERRGVAKITWPAKGEGKAVIDLIQA